jgi:hypothetical protein
MEKIARTKYVIAFLLNAKCFKDTAPKKWIGM